MTANLTVHRNTLAKRRRKNMQGHMLRAAKSVGTQDVRAWALVAVRADGALLTEWDTGGVMPMMVFPAVIKEALYNDMAHSGIEDDWRPSLTEIPGVVE